MIKFKKRVPAEVGMLNVRNSSATPETTRYTPNNTAAATTDGCGHARITTPSTTAREPDTIAPVQMSRVTFDE